MKAAHWIILSITLTFTIWFVYRTRDVQPRTDISIDLNWRFILGDPEDAQTSGYDDSQWKYVTIPHDWMIEQPVNVSNPSGAAGGFYPGGIGWYRKSLDLSMYQEKEHFSLLFEGVYRNADVYFNGVHLGYHANGYSSFYYDISELIRTDTLNIIAVRTDCSKMPADQWYSGAGIFRPVRLIATHSLHIPIWGSWVSSTIDSTGKADLKVSMEIKNDGRKAQRFEVRYDIVDPGGKLVAEGKSTRFLESGETDTTVTHFQIEKPLLWSPESPRQYAVNCYLTDGNRQIDHMQTNHGIRSLQFDHNNGLILNGRKIVLKGVCLHHDGGELGAAVPMESWRRRLTLLRELGVNAVRLTHNQHAPGMLDLCDEMGFMVVDEMYDKWEEPWQQDENHSNKAIHRKTDLTGFVRRDRNHPSVILWSIGKLSMNLIKGTDSGNSWNTAYPGMIFITSEAIEEKFVRAGIDHLGESAGWPDRGRSNGLLLTNGFIKPQAWYIGSLYLDDPMVKLTVMDTLPSDPLDELTSGKISWADAPLEDHWTFGPETDSGRVVIFTNCKKVELQLNNKLIASLNRNAFSDGVIRSTIPYEAGELIATAFYKDERGKEMQVSDTLLTADRPYALAMHPDRRQISANNKAVVHITTRVVDSTGILNPHSSHLVNYTLDGPGKIRVIDNGDLADHTPPGSPAREMRRGKQLLILQAGSEPGDLIISARADGLRPAKVKIKSKE